MENRCGHGKASKDIKLSHHLDYKPSKCIAAQLIHSNLRVPSQIVNILDRQTIARHQCVDLLDDFSAPSCRWERGGLLVFLLKKVA